MTFETLHLCNANQESIVRIDIETFIELMANNDAVVFYAEELNEIQYEFLYNKLPNHKCYFIIDNNLNHLNTINYDKWLDLVNQYNKTFTWK